MKMARDEHVIGFKSCDISIYWWIWIFSFLLKQISIGIDYFFWTSSQLPVQIWNYRLLQDRRLTVDCSHQHIGSHLLQAQCCVALSQPKKQSNQWSSACSCGHKFKAKVDFCVRSYLFRSIASEIIRDCIILSGERECDARDCFKS